MHCHRNFTDPTELEEIDESDDPFTGIEITSDVDGDGDDSDDNATIVIADPAPIEDIILDSATSSEEDPEENANSEGENHDPFDRDMDTEEDNEVALEEDGGPANINHWFDGAELGIIPPPLTHETEDQRSQRRYSSGCEWTSNNWSCSYDTVFMSFWSIYKESSARWRRNWVRYSPNWNGPLSNNFDHLTLLADTPASPRDQSMWFSRYRDRFRDQLSGRDPKSFPRWGPVPSSAAQILRVTFSRFEGPHLEQDLVCMSCKASTTAEIDICFLAYGLEQDFQKPTPLHSVWAQFTERYRTEVFPSQAKCHCCHQKTVKELKMPDLPLIWFEREKPCPVRPSLTLTFNSPSTTLTYILASIIYAGGNHFTVRFREKSGRWWKHDGQIMSGVPQPDNIQSDEELLMNGERFACILIYCLDEG